MNVKKFSDEKLKLDYSIVSDHIRLLLDDLKLFPDDDFLKSQLQKSREIKKELLIEIQLRGLHVKTDNKK